jgi:hypothetical protein
MAGRLGLMVMRAVSLGGALLTIEVPDLLVGSGGVGASEAADGFIGVGAPGVTGIATTGLTGITGTGMPGLVPTLVVGAATPPGATAAIGLTGMGILPPATAGVGIALGITGFTGTAIPATIGCAGLVPTLVVGAAGVGTTPGRDGLTAIGFTIVGITGLTGAAPPMAEILGALAIVAAVAAIAAPAATAVGAPSGWVRRVGGGDIWVVTACTFGGGTTMLDFFTRGSTGLVDAGEILGGSPSTAWAGATMAGRGGMGFSSSRLVAGGGGGGTAAVLEAGLILSGVGTPIEIGLAGGRMGVGATMGIGLAGAVWSITAVLLAGGGRGGVTALATMGSGTTGAVGSITAVLLGGTEGTGGGMTSVRAMEGVGGRGEVATLGTTGVGRPGALATTGGGTVGTGLGTIGGSEGTVGGKLAAVGDAIVGRVIGTVICAGMGLETGGRLLVVFFVIFPGTMGGALGASCDVGGFVKGGSCPVVFLVIFSGAPANKVPCVAAMGDGTGLAIGGGSAPV